MAGYRGLGEEIWRQTDGAVDAFVHCVGTSASLRGVAEAAGELGAARAMARIGLSDAGAAGDVKELRELLAAWRDARRSAVRAAVGWVGRMLVALVLVGIAAQADWPQWAR